MESVAKSKWLAALRSGQYAQGRNALCQQMPNSDEQVFCCLGVLVNEIYGFTVTPEELTKHSLLSRCAINEHYVGGLTTDQREELGITGSEEIHLMELNDDSRQTFNEIADYIEKNL